MDQYILRRKCKHPHKFYEGTRLKGLSAKSERVDPPRKNSLPAKWLLMGVVFYCSGGIETQRRNPKFKHAQSGS